MKNDIREELKIYVKRLLLKELKIKYC